ncbi:MAG: proton-conducting transporter membrane subunit [Dehalococcoidia bacterium]|nr:proton-conducting transporter membrane subunit [Dehalococcoidia bacterium]
MIPNSAVWLIIFLPVIAFLLNGLVMRPLAKEKSARYSGYITIACIAGSLGLSIWTVASVAGEGAPEFPRQINIHWLSIGQNFDIEIGLLVDKLSAIMVLVVSTCSLMIQIYSQGYMKGDHGYMRFFTWMPLFTAAMLGVALSGNLLFTFICWELVGLCSYLLIGFWYHRPSAATAAKKAFIVTRLADIGLVLALVGIYHSMNDTAVSMGYNVFNIQHLPEVAHAAIIGGFLTTGAFTWILLGIFAGAAGKSGQFPLHVWLPDAMEGPTPVSALIHSSTMVCAGVYLIARVFPLFAMPDGETAALVVAGVGGFTAIFSATMGMVMYDIKRVLAYSTLSQLGYMMLGLGTVAYGAANAHDPAEAAHLMEIGFAIGMFHLFTHAFFKSMLFLASGSVNHATGTFDMRLMGGLRRHQPWTFVVFLIGSLALAGIWPLAGFWSKDGILFYAWENTPWFFWFAMITVFMTAFYMFRVIFMTFYGEFRGGDPLGLPHAGKAEDGAHQEVHPHESPAVMVWPMVVLCVLAIGSGWAVGSLSAVKFLGGEWHGFFAPFTKFEFNAERGLPLLGLMVALCGIFTAYAIYSAQWISNEAIGRLFKPVRTLWYRKYYIDELYEDVLVRGVLMKGVFGALAWFDTVVVDGIVNGAAALGRGLGGVLRKLETGQLQEYGIAMGFGLVVIMAVILIGFHW